MRRATTRLSLALGAILVVGCIAAPRALAHVPTIERPGRMDGGGTTGNPYSRAQEIEAPVKSLAIYGYLAHDELFDAYAFSVPRPVNTEVELLVPARSTLRDFHPTLMVVEVGSFDSVTLQPMNRERFFEPFSAASFWRVERGRVSLQPGRRYYFVVRPGEGRATNGAYVIGVGGPEAFSGTDMAETLRVLPVIWSGGWGGGPLRPGAFVCVGLGLMVGVAVTVAIVRRRRRRRRS